MPGFLGLSGIFRYTTASDAAYIAAGSLFVVVAALGSPVQTFIYGKVFQKLASFLSGHYSSSAAFRKEMQYLCGLIISVGAIRMVFTWAGIVGWLLVGERAGRRARTRLFQSLLRQEPAWFSKQPNLVGSLTVVYRCIEEIRSGVSENMGLLVQTIASIVFYFCSAMYASWSLTLLVAAVIPLMGGSSYVFGRMISHFAQEENRLCAGAAKVLEWCLAHPDALRVLNGKGREEWKFGALVDKSARSFRRMSAALNGNSAVLKLLGNLVVMAALLFGDFLVRKNKATLGLVVTAFSSCLLLGGAVSSVADILSLLNKAHAACRTIDLSSCWGSAATGLQGTEKGGWGESICSTSKTPESLATSESRGSDWSEKKGTFPKIESVSVRNVSYGYGASHVIENVSADFSASQLNFIVGPSGCGKSTLAGIIAGFHVPDAGTIVAGGVDYRSVRREVVRSQITLVEAHAAVFSRSLAENLQLGNPQVASADVAAACEFADLQELQDRRVLNSETLSGGQSQKINLARAFVRDSPVLILDEAFGSINHASKTAILRRLRAWRRHKLTILVTHDVSELQPGDHVIHMDGGRIVASTGSSRPASAGVAEAGGRVVSSQSADLEAQSVEAEVVSASLPRLLSFWYRHSDNKGLVWAGLVASLCAGVLPPVLSYCYSRSLAAIVAQAVALGASAPGRTLASTPGRTLGTGSASHVQLWASLIAAVAVAESAADFAAKMSLDCAAEQWVVRLRKTCLHTINAQDLSFFATQKSARLNTLLMNDTRDLRHLVSEFLSGLLLVVSLTIVGVAWALALGWKLALVGVAFIPLVLGVTALYGAVLQKAETAYKSAVAAAEAFALETVSGIRTVHSYALFESVSRDFDSRLAAIYRCGLFRALTGGFGVALSEFCTSAATGVVLYYGVALVGKGAYMQNQMISVLTMLTFTVTSAGSLLSRLPEISRGQRAGTLIMQLVSLAASATEQPACPADMPHGPLDVRLEDVCFAYPDAAQSGFRPAVRSVSLTIQAGETVAITGPSGCGKSTLASLVTRLYMPDRGIIRVGGLDANTIDVAQYRDAVFLDLQEPQFQEATILENLTYGVRSWTEAEVVQCICAANAGFALAAEQGLQTVMGGGGGFSSGQMRRLAVARALLRRPQVLVMDEPTARLDADCTEALACILAHESTLRRAHPQLTVVVVTHDARVMQQCGRVVVMEAGRVTCDQPYAQFAATPALAASVGIRTPPC